jgi:hypothetical protein
MIDSSSGNKPIDKWQLLRKHQEPLSADLFRISVAFLLWPLPRERDVTYCYFSAANLIRISVGSTPVVSTKIIGNVCVDSA